MRILYVCLDRGVPVGATKGASTHLAEMVRALRAEGHEVVVAARSLLPGAAAIPLVPPATRATSLLRGPLSSVRTRVESRWLRRRLAEVVALTRPDLVYERCAMWRDEATTVAADAGVPLVLEVNAPLAEEAARFRRTDRAAAARRVETRVWRAADLVVVPSHPLAERVRGAGQPSVVVVPNAVDPDRFHPSADAGDTRERLGLADRFVVGFVGSLKPWHDLRTVVDGVAALPAAARASLLVVGEGPEGDDVARRAAAKGLHCVATGAVPHAQVPELVGAADVCVVSLLPDPAFDYFSPLKALEYLAAGRPAVVADVGDLRSLVDAGVAVGYRAGDAGSLSAALLSLATDPGQRAHLSSRGREHAGERTWREAARTVLAAAERAARTDAAPVPVP